ncbi:phage baseplate plug family protein [Bacillus sp. JJ722]|uniref:phage baseplate plug family protein n=1 Tax=Bacillus sp. JJ722 TaxID=3122973 RepID=UPI002FFE96E8
MIELNKEDIPCEFEVELTGELFSLSVSYNVQSDFFTVGLSKNGEVLCYGEKMVLNQPLFSQLSHPELPKVQIVPRANNAIELTYVTFGETVFIAVEGINE